MAYELRDFSDIAPATTVSADITNMSTSIGITSGTGYPSGGASGDFMILIESEIIRCSSRSGNTLTVSGGVAGRGQNGTAAVGHVAGVAVSHVHTATNDSKEANRAVAKTVGAATTSQDMLVADAANSFTRLPIGTNGTILQALAGAVAYAALPAGSVVAGTVGVGGISAANQFAAGVVDSAALGALAATTAKLALLAVTDAQVATANKDGVAATASMRTLGTGAQQATAGNDARLTDTRVPNGAAGGDLAGTYPNPTIGATQALESGDLKMSARSAPTTGWLLCDGAAIDRTTYAALFTAIGTTYGVGNGTTTFNVPDFKGRVLVGAGAGAGLTARTRGGSGGEENHTLTSGESGIANHTHTTATTIVASGVGVVVDSAGGAGGATTGFVSGGPISAPSSHNTMQPYGVANVFIKT